jgi:hypothetical protein
MKTPSHLTHCTTETIPGKSFIERPDYPAEEQAMLDRRDARPFRPLTYLACPYTFKHANPETARAVRTWRAHQATLATAWLIRGKQWNVLSPITHSHPLHEIGQCDGDWKFWEKIDREFIQCSQRMVVLMLDGWRISEGVQAEIKIAQEAGLPVEYLLPVSSGDFFFADDPDDYADFCIPVVYESPTCASINPDDANPKDLVGATKVPLWLVPPAAIAHCAMAMRNGAKKYGPYNWRVLKIRLSEYLSAIKRHLDDYQDGEDLAPDSKIHHLGHAMAGCAIILDALETGCLKDDRPAKGATAEVLARMASQIKAEQK